MFLETILRRPRCLAFLALFLANSGLASTTPLYPQSLIREWEPEFRAVVTENYARLFRPKLETHEAERLRTLRFEFPTDPGRVLLEFHTRPDGTVVLPVASLLLLKDLVAAQVWLEANGYSTQTLFDYLAIVRQGRLASWPASQRLPLKALGIPEGALGDKHLLEKRNDILSKTVLFILGHEIGHLTQGLSAQAECALNTKRGRQCDFAALQTSEAEADAFAIDMFRRIGLLPSASNFFFTVASRLSPLPFEFPNDRAWQNHAKKQTHPLDSARIHNAAIRIETQEDEFARGFASTRVGLLRTRLIVSQLKTLAAVLDDRNLSGMQLAWAKSLTPEDIKPRPTDEPRLRPTHGDLTARQPWTGFYTGMALFSNGNSAPLEIVMRRSKGNMRFTGEVMLGGIRGRIDGLYDNAMRAKGTWTVAGDTYRLNMNSGPTPGHLSASYQSTVGAASGRWSLTKKGP